MHGEQPLIDGGSSDKVLIGRHTQRMQPLIELPPLALGEGSGTLALERRPRSRPPRNALALDLHTASAAADARSQWPSTERGSSTADRLRWCAPVPAQLALELLADGQGDRVAVDMRPQ